MNLYRITTTGQRGGNKRTDHVHAPNEEKAVELATMDGKRRMFGLPMKYNRTTKKYELPIYN